MEMQLSQQPALEPNDATALTSEQQRRLNEHKVGHFPTLCIENAVGLRTACMAACFLQVKVRTDNAMEPQLQLLWSQVEF